VDEEARRLFVDWYKRSQPRAKQRLDTLLEAFGQSGGNEIAIAIGRTLSKSSEGNMALYPLIAQWGQLLWGRRIIRLTRLSSSILTRLSNMLETEPWKLCLPMVPGYIPCDIERLIAILDLPPPCLPLLHVTDAQRDALTILRALMTRIDNDGHCYLPRLELMADLRHMEASRFDISLTTLAIEGVVTVCDKYGHDDIYLTSLYEAETGICSYIKDLKQVAHNDTSRSIDMEHVNKRLSHLDPTRTLDDIQIAAVRSIICEPITILSGMGGCGKTEAVTFALPSLSHAYTGTHIDTSSPQEKERHNKQSRTDSEWILITAPTGRAARVLSRRTGFPAVTMHSAMLSWSNWKYPRKQDDEKGEDVLAAPSNWRYGHVRVWIIDEAGLAGLRLFYQLWRHLHDDAMLEKVIILGDHHQLPSIAAGNVFPQLCHIHAPLSSYQLVTCHRAESTIIVDNAKRILNGESLDLSQPAFRWYPIHNCSKDDFRNENGPARSQNEALRLAISQPRYSHDHTIIVCFRRKDVAAANEMAAKRKLKRNVYHIGDKVVVTRNAILREASQQDEYSVSNGDLFTIVKITLDDRPHGHIDITAHKEAIITLREWTGRASIPAASFSKSNSTCNTMPSTASSSSTISSHTKSSTSTRSSSSSLPIFIRNGISDDVSVDDKDGDESISTAGLVTFQAKDLLALARLDHGWARTIHTFQVTF
jgi:hypothetical protein